jgi:CHAD domain-containing protein
MPETARAEMNNAPLVARESMYVVSDELSAEVITNSLLALLPTRHRLIAKHRFTLLDTFDGRVRRAGAFLTRTGVEQAPTVNWQRSANDRFAIQVNRPVSFAWDLPNGSLREQVASVIGPRRLLAQADAEERGSLLEILDDRSKIVARLRIVCGQARLATPHSPWRQLPTTVTLTGLRGYEKTYDQLVHVIESRPGIQLCPDGPVGVMLRGVGTSAPLDLAARSFNLEPTIRADVGAGRIHLALLDVLVGNEAGLRANLDTEFLHDFRVAVRRTRSLLGQIRGVFPPDVVEHFKNELSWIGRITGPPRDLDVLVLALRERYEEFSRDDIDALIAFLGRTQQQEHDHLVEALDSDRYRRLLSDWKAFLDSPIPSDREAAHATDTLAAAVARRSWRLSKRIARRVKTVDERTTAEGLHEIRIDAKKLRYLVDVMPAGRDTADVQSILGALKKLQRALGDFIDAHVQERLLLGCGHAIGAAGGSAGVLLTLGRLAEQCRQRRDRLRRDATDQLSAFGTHKIRKACRRAFKGAYPVEVSS